MESLMTTAKRLTIELVPSTTWGDNLRKRLGPKRWDPIRKQAYADAGQVCAICGATGRLNCHERWIYDDLNCVQTLVGFMALCDLCHHCKHIGRAGILA